MNKKVLYHGSPVKFNKFDLNKIGTNVGTTGAGIGIYFSDSIKGAMTYGNYIYEVEFPNGKELSNFNRTLTNTKLNDILKNIYKISRGEDNFYENWFEDVTPLNIRNLKILDKMFDKDLTDTECIMNIMNAGGAAIKDMLNTLMKFGYTHTTDLMEHGITFAEETHYILYYEPKILEKYQLKNGEKI